MFTFNTLMVLMTDAGLERVEGNISKGHFTFRKEGLSGIHVDFFTETDQAGRTIVKYGNWVDIFDEQNNVSLPIIPHWSKDRNYKELEQQIGRLVAREEARARLEELENVIALSYDEIIQEAMFDEDFEF